MKSQSLENKLLDIQNMKYPTEELEIQDVKFLVEGLEGKIEKSFHKSRTKELRVVEKIKLEDHSWQVQRMKNQGIEWEEMDGGSYLRIIHKSLEFPH